MLLMMSANFRLWIVGVTGGRLVEIWSGICIIIARWGANQASTYLDSLLSALKLFGVNHGKLSTTHRVAGRGKVPLLFSPGTRAQCKIWLKIRGGSVSWANT